jgi:hypothetical protein
MVMASSEGMPESPLDVLSRAASLVERSSSGHSNHMEEEEGDNMDMDTNCHNNSSDSDMQQPDSPPQVHITSPPFIFFQKMSTYF